MQRFTNLKALSRTVAVVGAVMVLVGGVTFAALQSKESTIRGSSIQTKSAVLQLSADNVTYTNSLEGYTFTDVMPGSMSHPYRLYVKNNGQTQLNVTIGLGEIFENPDNIDLKKVRLVLRNLETGNQQAFTLEALARGSAQERTLSVDNPINYLKPGDARGYEVQVAMDEDLELVGSATLNNLDFTFDATAVL